MNFDELNAIIVKETGVKICPICGVPFEGYHRRQKTCGTDECKRLYHNQYLREKRVQWMTEDIAGFREYRRVAQRKSRRKKKETELMQRNYKKMQSYWERQIDVKERKLDGGLDYGKKQVEKTLAQVPKIDVSGFEKGDK